MHDRRYEDASYLDRRMANDEKFSERKNERVRLSDMRRDDYRFEEKQYSKGRKFEEKSQRQEGRNYRKELLERFGNMDLDDHHEFRDCPRYFK